MFPFLFQNVQRDCIFCGWLLCCTLSFDLDLDEQNMFIILTGIVPDLKSAIRIDDHVPLMFLLSSYYTVLLMSVSAMDEQG